MTIESKSDETVIRISADVNLADIKRSLDYIQLREITAKSKATQEDADQLAEESKQRWWKENGEKYFPTLHK